MCRCSFFFSFFHILFINMSWDKHGEILASMRFKMIFTSKEGLRGVEGRFGKDRVHTFLDWDWKFAYSNLQIQAPHKSFRVTNTQIHAVFLGACAKSLQRAVEASLHCIPLLLPGWVAAEPRLPATPTKHHTCERSHLGVSRPHHLAAGQPHLTPMEKTHSVEPGPNSQTKKSWEIIK